VCVMNRFPSRAQPQRPAALTGQSASASRLTAGADGFWLLIQSGDHPEARACRRAGRRVAYASSMCSLSHR
jgi:hypothetical protein